MKLEYQNLEGCINQLRTLRLEMEDGFNNPVYSDQLLVLIGWMDEHAKARLQEIRSLEKSLKRAIEAQQRLQDEVETLANGGY